MGMRMIFCLKSTKKINYMANLDTYEKACLNIQLICLFGWILS